LLREMRHRIANSLQIIASILLLKAGAVTSEETKSELRAAHQRVMSVAAVQSHLHASDGIEHIEIRVSADAGELPTSDAVSIGLIVTELIINAVKYAFPIPRSSAAIRVT